MGDDESKRKQAEEPVTRYERMLRRAEQLAGMGSWNWEIETNTLIWSDELYRIYGLGRGTPLSYETFIERLHPDDRERVRAIVSAALATGEPFQLQEQIVRPDGQIRVLDSQGEVERDKTGRPISMFGLCRDVTEEKGVQDALREREQRFSKMFHGSPIATTLTTLTDGRFVDVNTRFLEITGYRAEELIGHAPQVLLLWDTPKERDRLLVKLRELGSLREVAMRYRYRDGQVRRALAAIERIDIGGEECLLTLLWRA